MNKLLHLKHFRKPQVMKKILIVEGNLKEENQQFTNAGIQTHTESLKDSIAYFTKNLKCISKGIGSYKHVPKNFSYTLI